MWAQTEGRTIKMKSRRLLNRRQWLNPPKDCGGAHIKTSVNVDSYTSGSYWVEAEVRIADCSRIINLEFGFDSMKPKFMRESSLESTKHTL